MRAVRYYKHFMSRFLKESLRVQTKSKLLKGMGSKNFIELNGKRYDALTGEVLSDTAHKPKPAPAKAPAKSSSGQVLDGFTRRAVATHHTAHPKTPAKQIHHKTERSQTLMRQAVKKPSAPAHQHSANAHTVHHHAKTHVEIDPQRVARAQKVHKSHLVSRFGTPTTLKPTTSELPVQPEPTHEPEAVLVEHHRSPLDTQLGAKTPFDHAIAKATSHTQPRHKRTTRRHHAARVLRVSPKIINIAAGGLTVLLLTSFVAWQNVPNLSMQIASSRAGVQGRLPGYEPAGYAVQSPIEYRHGRITISYKSRSDTREFKLNQRTSGWNSATLRENYVALGERDYQTYQENGKTIYLYDGDNATWVDGGIWYEIKGNSSLTDDQLIRLAASM